MGNHYNRLSIFFCAHFQQRDHLVTCLGIKISGWLIRKQNLRSDSPSALAIATLCCCPPESGIRKIMNPVFKTQCGDNIIDISFIHFFPVKPQRKNDIFPHIDGGYQIECLKYKSDFSSPENGKLHPPSSGIQVLARLRSRCRWLVYPARPAYAAGYFYRNLIFRQWRQILPAQSGYSHD